MQVGFHLNNLVRFVRIGASQSVLSAGAQQTIVSQEDAAQLNLNRRRVDRAVEALNNLDELLARARIQQRSGISSVVSPTLGLADDRTATRLDSSEQINSATTSYSPFGPVFTGSGNSTALPTISGVYDGSNGDDTLRFRVTRTGTHTVSRIDVRVYNSNGNTLDTIRIQATHPIDREYTLSNGLVFTLGAGTLINGDDFYMNVYANTPSAVDPDKSFDGLRDDRPNFDDGLSVSAGSFDVNGITIAVNANDTINTVVDRINSSAAGVDAVYDSGSDGIKLTQRNFGSGFGIVLDNDDSGFLAATKLTGPALPGQDPESQIALDQTGRFAGVSSGAVLINGYNFNIDVTSDSLTDIVSMINDADIGVTASLGNGGQRFVLKADTEGISISLDDQGTQLFDALGVSEKTYRAVGSTGLSRSRTYRIADAATSAFDIVNEIFNPADNISASQSLNSLRDSILATLRIAAPGGDTGIGLQFSLDSAVGHRLATIDRQDLTRSLRQNLGGSQGRFGGLLTGLRGALAAYGANYGDAAVSGGTMLNTRA